ncbi:MAG: ribonuclease P protein component [Candidatus Sumerlaeia bacterium]|nr:ribonuclease P protein component [Candidatus Sumerlaeia bacterium]
MTPAFPFRPEQRLHSRKEYDLVFQQGRRCSRPLLVVFCLPHGDGDGPARLGMAVSRKVGKAVVRNKVRRRLREIFRLVQNEFLFPCDVVVVARPSAATADFDDLRRHFLRALCRLDALPEHLAPSSRQANPEKPV